MLQWAVGDAECVAVQELRWVEAMPESVAALLDEDKRLPHRDLLDCSQYTPFCTTYKRW